MVPQVAQEEREGTMGWERLIAQVDLQAHLC